MTEHTTETDQTISPCEKHRKGLSCVLAEGHVEHEGTRHRDRYGNEWEFVSADDMAYETDGLHEYEVWSTYKVTGTAFVRARTAAEAVEKALDVTADDAVQFIFGEPWGETKMRARRVTSPPGVTE